MFTKGEWELLEGVKPEYNGYVIRSVEWGVNLAYAETFDVEPSEAEANAHLISACPDMYKAMKELLEELGNPMQIPPFEVVNKASIALAKAEGKDER